MSDSLSKGDQARADILDAARRLFISQGYHGTSMRAIAREAGDRAVAGLYNHFPTKEAIFRALIEERNPYDDLFAALETALADAETGQQYVRQALKAVLSVMPRHFNFIQLAQIDLREFNGANLEHVLKQRAFPRVYELFQRLGTLPGVKPLNTVIWMRVMASLVIGFMITEQLVPTSIFGELSPDEWADEFARILLYGVADEKEFPDV